jgi:hypothetical protein
MSRHYRNADTGTYLERAFIWQCRRANRINCHIVGCTAKASAILSLVDEYALADSRLIYSITDVFDDASAVAVWDDESAVEEIRKRASPLLYVGRIDASGVKSHKHFTGCGFGFWEIA